MAFASWDESYAIGVDQVDDQHRRLFELVTQLYETMRDERDGDVGEILAELESYTVTHFSDEQSFMGDCGFSDDCADCFLAHQEAHDAFESEVATLRELYDSGDATVEMKTLRFLREWLAEHVGEVDQQIGTYLEDEEADLEPRAMSTELPSS